MLNLIFGWLHLLIALGLEKSVGRKKAWCYNCIAAAFNFLAAIFYLAHN